MGMEVQLHAFLTLAIDVGERCVISTEKDPLYPVDRRLGMYQIRSGPKSEEKHTRTCPVTALIASSTIILTT
jgi:hypothetical protein